MASLGWGCFFGFGFKSKSPGAGIGSCNFSMPDVTLSGGVKFTQQVSSHSDLDWNGFNLIPRVLLNMKFY